MLEVCNRPYRNSIRLSNLEKWKNHSCPCPYFCNRQIYTCFPRTVATMGEDEKVVMEAVVSTAAEMMGAGETEAVDMAMAEVVAAN